MLLNIYQFLILCGFSLFGIIYLIKLLYILVKCLVGLYFARFGTYEQICKFFNIKL